MRLLFQLPNDFFKGRQRKGDPERFHCLICSSQEPYCRSILKTLAAGEERLFTFLVVCDGKLFILTAPRITGVRATMAIAGPATFAEKTLLAWITWL